MEQFLCITLRQDVPSQQSVINAMPVIKMRVFTLDYRNLLRVFIPTSVHFLVISLKLKQSISWIVLVSEVIKLDCSTFQTRLTLTLRRILSRCMLSSSISAISSSSLTSPVRESSATPVRLSSRPPIFFAFKRIFPFRSYQRGQINNF